MPSGYPNAEQELVRIRNSGDTEEQVRAIIDNLQVMGEQIRYQFRHVENNELKREIRNNAAAQAVINRELEQQIEQESGVLLYIDSSRGTVFKSSLAETRLNVTVYKRGERITNAERLQVIFGPEAELQWSRQGPEDTDFVIVPSSDSRILNDGFTYVCAASEVSTKVCYKCTLLEDTVRAENQVTITKELDGQDGRGVDAISSYYLLQDEGEEPPEKPTQNPPGGDWSLTEPGYTEGSTAMLYTVLLTIYSDDSWSYSEVNLSSSYEAAKAAYSKAAELEPTVARVEAGVEEVETKFGELEHVMEYEYLKSEELGITWYDADAAAAAGYTEGAGYYGTNGRYYESATAKIQADARSIVESYSYVSETELTTRIADVTEEIERTKEIINGQIRRGVITDPEGNRHFGIAISLQNIYTSSTVEQAGVIYQVISQTSGAYGLYTATGWEFWIGNQKKGWFDSDSGDLHIEGEMTQNCWQYRQSDSFFGIKYIG